MADAAEFGAELRSPAAQAAQMASQQERIEQDVADAVKQLQRAARHEERLGSQELAEQLHAAAEEVAQSAGRGNSGCV